MDLKDIRGLYNISQTEVSKLTNIPIRTLRRYESDKNYGDTYKRERIINEIEKAFSVTEEKGILTIPGIKQTLLPILEKAGIKKCILFGSYAKGSPRETSDIDLLVETEITGLDFFNLIEEMRAALHKKIDLLRLKDLTPNNPIILEILKDGIRIL